MTDPASDPGGEARARAGLGRELSRERTSRHRRRRWVLAGSTGVLAVAVAAAAVVVVSRPGSRLVARSGSVATPPHVAVRDAADVVRHVEAMLVSADRANGLVTSSVDASGSPVYHDVVYLDPRTGSFFQADRAETRGGRVLYENVDATVFVGGQERSQTFWIDYTQHTWSADSTSTVAPSRRPAIHPFTPRLAGVRSTPQAVARALASHLERRVGTTTVDGVRALVLTGRDGIDRITLDVDAQTYQPLRETEHGRSRFADVDQVTDVLAATPSNIALARRRPDVPAGYTFVQP